MIEKLKPLLMGVGLIVHEDMSGPTGHYKGEDGKENEVPAILLKVKTSGEEFTSMYNDAEDKERFELMFIRDQILINANEHGYKNIALYTVKYEILNENEHQISVRFGRW
jgi:hypothetical protein